MARDATLTAVRAVDGEVLWSHDGLPNQNLTVAEPSGLYASDGSGVIAYDPNTGEVKWRRELIGSGNVLLAANEAMVCAEILAYLECWDASNGEPLWSRPIDFADWLLVTADRVIVDSQTGSTALDARAGEVVWESPLQSFAAPAISDENRFILACSSTACSSVGMEDGRIAWSLPFDGRIGEPAVAGGRVYVTVNSETTSTLFMLDATTGAILERILPDPFDGSGFSSRAPAIGQEFVFLFGGFGNMYVFERAP
jgi:outer membrane protein assembly factor BamB